MLRKYPPHHYTTEPLRQRFSVQCTLYVQYHEQPVCTSLLFTLLFIKSQYTVFFLFVFCTSYCFFFAHLVVFLHISLSFAHLIVFCTSYCFALFFISLHILLLFLLFLPYVCPCVMLLIQFVFLLFCTVH